MRLQSKLDRTRPCTNRKEQIVVKSKFKGVIAMLENIPSIIQAVIGPLHEMDFLIQISVIYDNFLLNLLMCLLKLRSMASSHRHHPESPYRWGNPSKSLLASTALVADGSDARKHYLRLLFSSVKFCNT